jgi:hypothetical protein
VKKKWNSETAVSAGIAWGTTTPAQPVYKLIQIPPKMCLR